MSSKLDTSPLFSDLSLLIVAEYARATHTSKNKVYQMLHGGFFPPGVVFMAGQKSYRIHLKRALDWLDRRHRENEIIQSENKRASSRARI